MNIFVLSQDPVKSAKQQCDQHVVKQILECAQLLSTAMGGCLGSEFVGSMPIYRSTHCNHPVTRWVMSSSWAYAWTCTHALALCAEYTERFGRVHKSQPVIEFCSKRNVAPHGPFSGFCLCAYGQGDIVGGEAAVRGYRALYAHKAKLWLSSPNKRAMRWTGSMMPSWLASEVAP